MKLANAKLTNSQQVIMSGSVLKISSIKVATWKLDNLQLSPYKIVEKINNLNYHLDLPTSMSHIHPIFYIDKLSLWKGNNINSILPPPPESVEQEEGT